MRCLCVTASNATVGAPQGSHRSATWTVGFGKMERVGSLNSRIREATIGFGEYRSKRTWRLAFAMACWIVISARISLSSIFICSRPTPMRPRSVHPVSIEYLRLRHLLMKLLEYMHHNYNAEPKFITWYQRHSRWNKATLWSSQNHNNLQNCSSGSIVVPPTLKTSSKDQES